jgi:beta-phosphoglucomutase family hydrolase
MSTAAWFAIFDWDGVIVDSSAAHEESWERLAAEGRRALPPDHFQRSFGMKNEVIIPELLGWTRDPQEIRRLSLRKEALYREVVKERGLEALPGVLPFLESLEREGVRRAIASSTHRLNIDTALSVLGLGRFFGKILTAEDVSRGKPHPEPFLKAAELLGAPPARCVVFEDAHVGIEAARAAGMKVVALATTHPAETLRDADLVLARLDEAPLAKIAALVERRARVSLGKSRPQKISRKSLARSARGPKLRAARGRAKGSREGCE